MVKEVGLITYHAAYNYGSVLQAWATQHMIEQLGYKCKIINYRMKSITVYYASQAQGHLLTICLCSLI